MSDEIQFHRVGYESRIDVRADEIESFVGAVLLTIDFEAARSSPEQWELVCRYFEGCAQAAKVQGNTPGSGGRRIADFLSQSFDSAEPSQSGFFEFMDWLNDPAAFKPRSLRSSLDEQT